MPAVSVSRRRKKKQRRDRRARSAGLTPEVQLQRELDRIDDIDAKLRDLDERADDLVRQILQRGTASLIGAAGDLTGLAGPREIEDAVAGRLGDELSVALAADLARAPFDSWFEDLLDDVQNALLEAVEKREDAWRGLLRLLYGLASVASGEARTMAEDNLANAQMQLRRSGLGGDEPRWLRSAVRVRATGRTWRLADRAGGMHGVLAEMDDRSGATGVYLWMIDACWGAIDCGGGWFDDADAAARQWREQTRAVDAELVESDDLALLVQVDPTVKGVETKAATDEFFRYRRRVEDVRDSWKRLGRPEPAPARVDADAEAARFGDWLAQHGVEAAESLVREVVEEGCRYQLGEVAIASAHHASFVQSYLTDVSSPDDPELPVLLDLFAHWFRFVGARRGLSPREIDRLVDVMHGAPLADDECPVAFAR